MPRSEWDKLRQSVYEEYGHECGICGAKGRLNCHEIWEYDDERVQQRLIGFIALCDWCHHVKHLGLAEILAKRGQLNYEKLVEHFMSVNDCDFETFQEHRRKSKQKWIERSKHDWKVDLGEYSTLITEKKPETG